MKGIYYVSGWLFGLGFRLSEIWLHKLLLVRIANGTTPNVVWWTGRPGTRPLRTHQKHWNNALLPWPPGNLKQSSPRPLNSCYLDNLLLSSALRHVVQLQTLRPFWTLQSTIPSAVSHVDPFDLTCEKTTVDMLDSSSLTWRYSPDTTQ